MIIVAIDEINFNKAINIINNLDSSKCMIKIGSVAFNSLGHKVIEYVAQKGFGIFLDLKLHDIPNTVSAAIDSLSKVNPDFLTVHLSGGNEMIKAAVNSIKKVLDQ